MKMSLPARVILLRGLPLFSWMGVIFFFSSLHGSAYPYEVTLSYYLERKGAHVLEYAVLMILAVRLFFALFPRDAVRRILMLSAAFAITYALSDELHQFFVSYRGAKMSDVLIDGLGVLLSGAVVAIAACARKRGR